MGFGEKSVRRNDLCGCEDVKKELGVIVRLTKRKVIRNTYMHNMHDTSGIVR